MTRTSKLRFQGKREPVRWEPAPDLAESTFELRAERQHSCLVSLAGCTVNYTSGSKVYACSCYVLGLSEFSDTVRGIITVKVGRSKAGRDVRSSTA